MVADEQERTKDDQRIRQEREIREEFIKNKTKGTHSLAMHLTRKYDIITVGEKEREMFVYRDGMYFKADNEIIYPENAAHPPRTESDQERQDGDVPQDSG